MNPQWFGPLICGWCCCIVDKVWRPRAVVIFSSHVQSHSNLHCVHALHCPFPIFRSHVTLNSSTLFHFSFFFHFLVSLFFIGVTFVFYFYSQSHYHFHRHVHASEPLDKDSGLLRFLKVSTDLNHAAAMRLDYALVSPGVVNLLEPRSAASAAAWTVRTEVTEQISDHVPIRLDLPLQPVVSPVELCADA